MKIAKGIVITGIVLLFLGVAAYGAPPAVRIATPDQPIPPFWVRYPEYNPSSDIEAPQINLDQQLVKKYK
jgi:hypothetical protein